jgi:hypothetical protein
MASINNLSPPLSAYPKNFILFHIKVLLYADNDGEKLLIYDMMEWMIRIIRSVGGVMMIGASREGWPKYLRCPRSRNYSAQ